MKAADTCPPPLPGRAPTRAGGMALRSLALLLGLMALAWVAMRLELPLPPCPLRETTGVPCPFCSSTRTFAALARLDFAGALQLNPLVCLAACGAGAVWLLMLLRGDERWKRLKASWTAQPLWKWLLAAALALNWLYIWFHLPR